MNAVYSITYIKALPLRNCRMHECLSAKTSLRSQSIYVTA